MNFAVIGLTDAPTPQLSPEALRIVSTATVFSGGRRHHELVAPLLPDGAVWIDIVAPVDQVFRQYAASFSGHNGTAPGPTVGSGLQPLIVVFASGDPLFYGFASTVRRLMPEATVTVYPTFNSLQVLAHRLVVPYHDMRVVSLTGRPWPAFDRALIEGAPMIGILTDGRHTPAAIARRMTDYGYTHYTMHVGEHLGNPVRERVSSLTLAEAAGRDFGQPCSVLLTATDGGRERTYGLPDASFRLLDGRQKMITKMPIRLLTLQALDLPRRHTLWDIGACTGSVSIEARRLFPHLHVVAFEVRPECQAIIDANARHHGAPGIELHIADFLSLPCSADEGAADGQCIAPPDAVFIGGHGGRLADVMAKAVHHLAPGGVVVMNSVSTPHIATDSRQLWDDACRRLGLVQEPPLTVQIDTHNPITILKCHRPDSRHP